MNKAFAWFLGYLLSDGAITHPAYRGKGDETHMQFICKYDDRELMHKVKDILHTKAIVHDYPQYKSPQSKIRVYDRRDVIDRYADIKEKVPAEDIFGFERHFIRGCFDGDGTLSYRVNRGTFRIGFIDEKKEITDWICNTICNNLGLPSKNIRWVPQNHVYEVLWEGKIANIIAWWLYHGDIDICCLSRKKEIYKHRVLEDHLFQNEWQEMLCAANAYVNEDGNIGFCFPSTQTLRWCKILQTILPVHTVPVFHNKGKRKYYQLYIPDKNFVANMRDM